MNYNLEELTYIDIKKRLEKTKRIIIPFGTLEAHGPHLPIGTDNICAKGISDALAKSLNAFIAPCLSYGLTNVLFSYPTGSDFDNELYEKFVIKIISDFLYHGFKTFILVNGHGGNVRVLNKIANDLSQQHKAVFVVVHWWMAFQEIAKSIYNEAGLGHSGYDETAMVLAFQKELVKKENFTKKAIFTINNGINCFPCEGTIITNKPLKDLKGLFDTRKARKFTKKIIDKIVNYVKESVDYLEDEFEIE